MEGDRYARCVRPAGASVDGTVTAGGAGRRTLPAGCERIWREGGAGGNVGFATVITWFATVLLGLFMLAVWLIENDVTGQGVAPSRLPVPVIFAHLGLAATGLTVWTAFLIFNQKTLAWTAVGILGAIALLGATMFARWIPVYRGPARPQGPAQLPGDGLAVPAEGNFPVAVVAVHGLLAVSTLVLALLTVLGTSGR